MSQTGTKVDGIIKALSGLESDIDSLNLKLDDMKKQLNSKAQKEIDDLMEKTKEIASKEAENIISESKSKAESESEKIHQKGEEKLTEIQKNIESNFDSAVKDVISSVLKPYLNLEYFHIFQIRYYNSIVFVPKLTKKIVFLTITCKFLKHFL